MQRRALPSAAMHRRAATCALTLVLVSSYVNSIHATRYDDVPSATMQCGAMQR